MNDRLFRDSTSPRAVCVIPAFNEEGKIADLLERLSNAGDIPVIVVDDGSRDGTAAEVRASGARLISHSQRAGVGAALRTGYAEAVALGYEIIVTLGGDNQDDPRQIHDLVEPLRRGTADLVQGSRRLGNGLKGMPLSRRIATTLYSKLFSVCSGTPTSDATNGFRSFRSRLLADERINLNQSWLNTYELEPYLLFKAVTLGYRVIEVGVSKSYDRARGFTKMAPGRDWWRILRPVVYLRLGLRR